MLNVAAAGRPAPVRWYLKRERLVLGVFAFVAVFTFWQVGASTGLVTTYFFSSPALIVQEGIKDFQTSVFLNDIWISIAELFIGYAIGSACGVVVGLLAGWYRGFNLLIDPWLSFFYSLPKIVIIPLLVLWFGLNSRAVVAAVFFGTFLTVLINTLHGVHTVERRFLDVATSFRASRRRLFTTVILPATIPFIVGGLRVGVGHAMIGVYVGELWASTSAGLGYWIGNYGDVAEATPMFVGIIVATAIGLVMFTALKVLEARFQEWRPNARPM